MNKVILILIMVLLSNVVFGQTTIEENNTFYKNGSALIDNKYINNYTKYITDNLLARLNNTNKSVEEEVVEEVKEKVELPPPTNIGFIFIIIVIIIVALIIIVVLIYVFLFKGNEYNIDKHMNTKGDDITDVEIDDYLKKI